MAKPFSMGIFGQQHAGKSYNLQQLMKVRHGTKIVLNPGRKTDWPSYTRIRLKEDKKKLYFNDGKGDFLFNRSFLKKYKNKEVKIVYEADTKVMNLFWRELAYSEAFEAVPISLVIDDATGVLDARLNKMERNIFSRMKHVGIWGVYASHDPHYFPLQLWGLLTHIRLFKTINPPPLKKKDSIPFYDKLVEAWEHLQEAPQYSYYTLDIYKRELQFTAFKN